MDLILDVKIYIALFDEKTWIKMVLYDEAFCLYAYTEKGKKQFVNAFKKNISGRTYLFGYLHSFNDEPAEVYQYGNKWYYNGSYHRENDLPAVIWDNGDQEWWYNGKQHRENDLPAIMYNDGYKCWWYKGKRHRENNLHAIIYSSGEKEWWYEGVYKTYF